MGKDKTPKKDKKEKEADGGEEDAGYAEKAKLVAVIAKPLADEKLAKKVLKLTKKASKRKSIRRGVKEVVKALRKNQKGICVLAGDISPVDVLTHIPIICEDHGVPYIYVPSKEDLGAAALSKRPTSCMLVLPQPPKGAVDDDEQKEYSKDFSDAEKKIKAAMPVF